MAGHSKYKNIMYRKGAQDKKRSALFSKLSREITVAAKMGLPDPEANARLRAAVIAARAQSMPKDNIQRSIDKAAGADAVESDDDGHRIWTSIDSLHEVSRALEPMLGEGEGAKLAWKPSTEVEVRGDDAANLMKLIDALEEDDDVQTVWGNYDVPEEELEKLA